MAKQKNTKKAFYKTVGFYFTLIYAVLTIALLFQAFQLNLLPTSVLLILSAILLLLLLLFTYLQLGNRVSKFNKTLGKILMIILAILLACGNTYLHTTNRAFHKMTSTKKDITVYSVVVMKESELESIDDLKNKKIAKMSIGNIELQNDALDKIETEINASVHALSYEDYKTYGDDLYNGKVDAILLNEAHRSLCEDEHSDFSKRTRILKQYEFEKQAKDISKSVDVTKDPFNVYISGIDTYGSISTVSRSDVNMIVSINPTTHQILMTGIPRDFYIPQTCQANQLDKLTHTGIFGVDCTIESMENFMNIDLNYYTRVNFSSLIDIVNALGGIEVNSTLPFTLNDGTQVVVGANHLNGEQALSFVRERYSFQDGDRERSRNQMRVLTGIINKALSPTIITNYTGILSAVSDSFQTNMTQKEMTSFVKAQVKDLQHWNIEQIQVSGQGATKWTPANGFNAYVMIPNENTVHNATRLIKKVMNNEIVTKTDVEEQHNLVANAG